MDNLLRCELGDGVVRDLPDFVDRFFPPSAAIADVYEHALRTGLYDAFAARWSRCLSPAAEQSVLTFFQDVVDNHLLHRVASSTPETDVYRYMPSNEAMLRNGDCMRKTDLLLTTQVPPADRVDFAALRPNRYDWQSVRVVGELKCNPDRSNKQSTLLQLANYARDVFGAQPSRRSVHAFTLCGHHLRAWLFDRSGAIGSTLVDINAEPVLFLRIVCGYAAMDAMQLGFDPSIKWDRGEETVYDPTVALASGGARPYIYANLDGATVKLEIKTTLIFSRHAIVTRGSACWKALDIATTVRRDLVSAKRKRSATDPTVATGEMPPAPKRRLVPAAPAWRPSHNMSSSQKRTASDALPAVAAEMPPPPRRRSVSTAPARSTSRNGSSSRKRKASDAQPASSSNSKKIKVGEHSSSGQAAKPVVAHPDSPPKCNNRILSRLVMTPIGKGLEKFSSYTELLAALRDTIKGHQHLYQKHHILHRDVSVYNILILPPGHPSAGVLIDLDLAINPNRAANSGASHLTGTPDFMAVGVLEGEPHRACHDLESFFFVPLWLATFYDADANRRQVTGTLFQACNTQFTGGGDFEDVSMVKRAFLAADQFERKCLARLDDDASAALGPLLSDWRGLLFDARNEPRLWDDMHAAVVRRLEVLHSEAEAV
ncbi:hypothetical protein FN846DRAFT_773489 [Sphaerosporella brunnea]|uniref:non-specific serine/threonine protein kinase n=1 Tax=Sphaerosporella brunnea TaxID=1250544 RepID=A0A5J5F673_9PEZI|nr:hypothetical protein FN846DRAFT_773489 [Sphaerosporella brunnea]